MSIVRKSVLWSVSLVCLSCLLVAAVQVQGQQPGQQGQRRSRGFSGFGSSSSLELLRRDDVKKELELLDDQVKQIEALREKSRSGLRDSFSGLRDLSQEERRERFAKLREKLQASNKEIDKEVNEKILLPHQSKRLAQIRFQMRLRRSSGTGAFTSTTVVEALGISEQQQEKLKKLQSQIDQDLRKQIAKLREQARQKILKELTTEQRAKYKNLVGEPFEATDPPRRFGGGNFRRDGNRGRRDRSSQRPNN